MPAGRFYPEPPGSGGDRPARGNRPRPAGRRHPAASFKGEMIRPSCTHIGDLCQQGSDDGCRLPILPCNRTWCRRGEIDANDPLPTSAGQFCCAAQRLPSDVPGCCCRAWGSHGDDGNYDADRRRGYRMAAHCDATCPEKLVTEQRALINYLKARRATYFT